MQAGHVFNKETILLKVGLLKEGVMGKIILLHKPDLAYHSIPHEDSVLLEWIKLVRRGEDRAGVPLGEDLESFLVFTLMRLMRRTNLFSLVLAVEYLETINTYTGKKREIYLSDIGDMCLIHAGLFPERYRRFGIHSSYFGNIGSAAFSELAELFSRRKQPAFGNLYQRVGDAFPSMVEVLLATRENTDYLERYSLLKI